MIKRDIGETHTGSLDDRMQEIEITKTQIDNATSKTVIGTVVAMLGVGLLAKSYNLDPNAVKLGFGLSACGAVSIFAGACLFGSGIHTISDKVKQLYDLATGNYSKE